MSDELRPVVMCGPSGVGKTTLKEMLMEKYPGKFGFSVSHTTRPPRTGEVDGRDYFFSGKADMEEMIKEDKFVEYARVHRNIYGTSISAVQSVREAGKICILDIDIQGVKTIMNGSAHKELMPYYIFVQPHEFCALEARLRKRATDTEEQIQTRIETAKKEIAASKTVPFDKFLTNENLGDAFVEYESFFLDLYPSLSKQEEVAGSMFRNRRCLTKAFLSSLLKKPLITPLKFHSF